MRERIPLAVAIRVPFKAYLSDGVTPATGKTIAITISKNMVAFANPNAGATNATEVPAGSNGWYYVDLDTTDTGTLGPLVVHGAATGVDNVDVAYNVVNQHNAGFDGVPNVVAGANTGLPVVGTQVPNAVAGAASGLSIVGSQMDLVNAPNATALNAIADAELDRANAIEVGLTPRQAHKLEAAAAAGKLSGAATNTVTIRNAVADSKNRVVATVDANGNRTAVVTDVS